MKICFFGDSITDMFRFRDNTPLARYGFGYVYQASEVLLNKDHTLEIFNTGISGNRLQDLLDRVDGDVISIKPDVLTILIGVNDVWRCARENTKPMSLLSSFTSNYQYLINKIKDKLPNTRLILMEPFFLSGTETDPIKDIFLSVYKYAKAVKKLAKINNLEFVPLQKPLTKRGNEIGNSMVLYDGVHPDIMGGRCIADNWLKTYYRKK